MLALTAPTPSATADASTAAAEQLLVGSRTRVATGHERAPLHCSFRASWGPNGQLLMPTGVRLPAPAAGAAGPTAPTSANMHTPARRSSVNTNTNADADADAPLALPWFTSPPARGLSSALALLDADNSDDDAVAPARGVLVHRIAPQPQWAAGTQRAVMLKLTTDCLAVAAEFSSAPGGGDGGSDGGSPDPVTALVQRLEHTTRTARDAAAAQGADAAVTAGLHHQYRLWSLTNALYGCEHGAAQTQLASDAVECLHRREAVALWLQDTVEPPRVDGADDAMARVWSRVVRRDVVGACEEALASGYMQLATLLAQAGTSEESTALVRHQYRQWLQQEEDVAGHSVARQDASVMAPALLRVYALLGGALDDVDGCAEQWDVCLGMHLWHGPAPSTAVRTVMEALSRSICSGHASVPAPWYRVLHPAAPQSLAQEVAARDAAAGPAVDVRVQDAHQVRVTASDGSPARSLPLDRDACYQLLQVYSSDPGAYPLAHLLSPASSADSPLDFTVSWLLMTVLSSLPGLDHAMGTLDAEQRYLVVAGMCATLEWSGLWHLAVFVASRLVDGAGSVLRGARAWDDGHAASPGACLAREILLRHVPTVAAQATDDVARDQLQYLQSPVVGLPRSWLLAATAQRAYYDGDFSKAATCALQAGLAPDMHRTLVAHLLLNDGAMPEDDLFDHLAAVEHFPGLADGTVPLWQHQGGLLLDVRRACDEARAALQGGPPSALAAAGARLREVGALLATWSTAKSFGRALSAREHLRHNMYVSEASSAVLELQRQLEAADAAPTTPSQAPDVLPVASRMRPVPETHLDLLHHWVHSFVSAAKPSAR